MRICIRIHIYKSSVPLVITCKR